MWSIFPTRGTKIDMRVSVKRLQSHQPETLITGQEEDVPVEDIDNLTARVEWVTKGYFELFNTYHGAKHSGQPPELSPRLIQESTYKHQAHRCPTYRQAHPKLRRPSQK